MLLNKKLFKYQYKGNDCDFHLSALERFFNFDSCEWLKTEFQTLHSSQNENDKKIHAVEDKI